MLVAAYSIFIMNLAFGVLVRWRVIDSARFRIVHHVLYFIVMASLLAAVLMAFGEGSALAWPLAGMAALLLGMALLPGRGRAHRAYAIFCCAVYSAILLWQ